MILTPKELHDRKDEFTIVDVRSEKQITEFPMDGLETITFNAGSIPNMKDLKCWFANLEL